MADEDDDLYAVFPDFLHENEGGLEALREWRRKKAIEAVRRTEKERRCCELEEAIGWCVARRKQSREGGG